MRSTIAIDVAGSPSLVFDLARGVERWADLLPHYLESRAIARQPDGAVTVGFVARRELVPWLGIGVPVAWRARTWSEAVGDAAPRLRFVHLGGATAGMDVTWRIEPTTLGCRVTIAHDFRPRIRPWAAVLDRLVIRAIAGRTLRTFKAIAEAVADAERETGPAAR